MADHTKLAGQMVSKPDQSQDYVVKRVRRIPKYCDQWSSIIPFSSWAAACGRTSVTLLITSLVFLIQTSVLAEESTGYLEDNSGDLEVIRLENGMEVVLRVDRTHPRIVVSMTYAVGQRDQPQGGRGMTRLLQNLMFRGSRHIASDGFSRHLDRVGATEIGAMSLVDDTTFYSVVPSNQLATALWLESDRMAYLLDQVDEESLDQARAAVMRELGEERYQSVISGLDERVEAVIFPEGHPYRRLGDSETDLQRLELEHVQWFFQRWFAPHNARLALVGDFDAVNAREIVERYFGSIRASFPAAPRPEPPDVPSLEGEHRITYGAQTSARLIRLYWATPAFLTQGDAELDYLATILGEGLHSCLHRRLLSGGLAIRVSVRQVSRELGSYFVIHVQAAPERDLEEILQAIDRELQQLCESAPEPEDYRRAFMSNTARELINGEEAVHRALRLSRIRSPLSPDEVYRREQDLVRYSEVTPETVREAACRYLPIERRLVVFIVPWNRAPDAGEVVTEEVLR